MSVTRQARRPADLRVLNLVSNKDARFYQQQTKVLGQQGVECVTSTPPGDHFTDGNVDRKPMDYVKFFPKVVRESLSDYDLVHANYGLTAPMALAQVRKPVVLSLWGSDLMGEYGWLSKRCARHCDAVIVMSEEMARELGKPCYVIPHGIDTERFAPESREAARAKVGWNPDKRHVLFPYPKTHEVKDYSRTKEIVERASERVEADVELQVVSSVAHTEVPNYMNAADALLLTSRREGSPNSVKEAMSCNLPVVSTDVGDVRERMRGVSPATVSDDDDDLVDGLVDVLEEPRHSNGREAVREVSLERMGERIRGVYETVL